MSANDEAAARDWTKATRTKGGQRVRGIFNAGPRTVLPLCGMIHTAHGDWESECWGADGTFIGPHKRHPADLDPASIPTGDA